MDDEPPIFTIGHSTRSISRFVNLLRVGPADLVVDVRTVPRSRHNPQFNVDAIGAELSNYDISYVHMPGLGGLRGRSSEVSRLLNGLWKNESFHNYADYALSKPFAESLDALLELGQMRRCAIMCAEAVWWRCHRRIIADYLLARGSKVFHLMGNDRVEPAKLTPGAREEDYLVAKL